MKATTILKKRQIRKQQEEITITNNNLTNHQRIIPHMNMKIRKPSQKMSIRGSLKKLIENNLKWTQPKMKEKMNISWESILEKSSKMTI